MLRIDVIDAMFLRVRVKIDEPSRRICPCWGELVELSSEAAEKGRRLALGERSGLVTALVSGDFKVLFS
jgi:hypothetical protein